MPDLILLDVNMPDMSGFEVCRILRKDSIYKSLPIVFVTGAEDTASKIKGLEVGGNDYIIKPVRHGQLIQIAKAHLRAKRILVIDDDKAILESLSLFLSKNGFEVVTAKDGEEGLAIFKGSDINIVLVDVRLPGISGLEVLKEIKELNEDCLVIAITGRDSLGDALQAIGLGAYDYLTKPFSAIENVAMVCRRGLEHYYRNQQKKNMIETLKRLNGELLDKSSQLELAQAQLVQSAKLAAMGEFGAGVAHELNQPLTGITIYMESIKKKQAINADPEILDIIEKVKNQLKRMSGVVDNLRTFARDAKPHYEELDINQPLLDGFNLLRQQMLDHGIDAQIRLRENLPRVKGDVNRLQQVFINIIANAKDALSEMEQGADKRVLVESKLSCGGRMVEVRIEDNGPGMDKDVQTRIFDPFFTTKQEGKGTGLGLSISYGIVKDHHGCISLNSNPGKGASFSIFLPSAGNNLDWDSLSFCQECEHKREGKICDVLLEMKKGHTINKD
ncbi:MAG: response regulator [Candidatus Omnitrophica bacterium]|nr:response regulator [Candidatus Omnitrophota bacterium]